MSEFFAWIFSILVVSPLQADIAEQTRNAGATLNIIQQSQQCIASQAPKLIERAGNDMWWASTTAIGVTAGWTDPVSLLDPRDPACSALVGLIKQPGDDV